MKVNFFFVCDNLKTEGKLTAEGIFDSIAAEGFPALHPKMSVILNIEVAEEEQNKEHAESFKILFGDKVIVESSSPFVPATPRHQLIHHIEGLLLEGPGRYEIQEFVDGKKMAETYFLAKAA